jgi:hypothetical protein
MSIAALAAVNARVGEIRSHFSPPRRSSFAEALQLAEKATAATGAVETGAGETFVVAPSANRATGETTGAAYHPIGIMGTPVVLRPGATATGYFAAGPWTDSLPAAGRAWAPAIESAAAAAGIDPRLLAAMVWQESGFQPNAVSSSGAIGLTQLMPATAGELGVDPHDPIENLNGGARYLAWTIREFGSIELGLAAYNAGPGNVRAAGGIPDIPETQAYVPRVIDFYRQLGGVA